MPSPFLLPSRSPSFRSSPLPRWPLVCDRAFSGCPRWTWFGVPPRCPTPPLRKSPPPCSPWRRPRERRAARAAVIAAVIARREAGRHARRAGEIAGSTRGGRGRSEERGQISTQGSATRDRRDARRPRERGRPPRGPMARPDRAPRAGAPSRPARTGGRDRRARRALGVGTTRPQTRTNPAQHNATPREPARALQTTPSRAHVPCVRPDFFARTQARARGTPERSSRPRTALSAGATSARSR